MDELDLGIVERRIAEGDYLAARVISPSSTYTVSDVTAPAAAVAAATAAAAAAAEVAAAAAAAADIVSRPLEPPNSGLSGGAPTTGDAAAAAAEARTATADQHRRQSSQDPARLCQKQQQQQLQLSESVLQAIAVRKLQLLPLREWEDEQRARREDFFRSIGDVVETVVSVFQHSERDHQDLLKFFRGRAKADKEAARALKHCSVRLSTRCTAVQQQQGNCASSADLIRQASTGNSSILSELSPRRLPEAPLWEEWDDAAREGCGTSRRKPAGSNEGNKNSGTPPWVSEAFEQMRADSGSGPDAISSASVAAVSATGITSAVSLAAEPHVSGGQQFVEVQGVSMLATATPEDLIRGEDWP
ncbi:uncharacterized protein LOC34621314 [Cyclospora cayetanensis]|uniref:Uncharacterized protein LOC34621314 n=1 Tax=Cyclospora cayetanensis TaxID=88456 RepID=A0A6P6S1Q8_9EIME|nr:uncharacterized protein LOC34621314 [Cyclospora cayetanensis]